MKAFCMFEQSGTFKNEFKKLGIDAYDFDILDDFGETDFRVDLFAEIEKAYEGGASVFDDITPDDVVLAFFPCTMFQEHNALIFTGEQIQIKSKPDEQKLEMCMSRHKTLHSFYCLISKLFLVAIKKGIRMVVENPASPQSYLVRYFPIKPTMTDPDRRDNGDHFKKPTNYWFVNFKPERNVVFEPLEYVKPKRIEHLKGNDVTVQRSMIHPQYANRFIRQYLLKREENQTK